jgi:opacity protein-like surface antigen
MRPLILLQTLAVAAATVVASSAAARAADMPGNYTLPPPRSMDEPVVHRVEVYSGWYLRGDLGARWGNLSGAESTAPFADPTDSKLNTGFTASIGGGFKSDWLRTDVTIDYASALKYQGTVVAPGDVTAKIQPTTALFNGYIDLGTWYRLTPYIGGGAGVAYTRVSGYSGPDPPFSGADKNQWGLAWAAMAGVSYPVSRNMMVDVGYRYLNIGNVKTASDASGDMTFKNVGAHEVRVGLRWSFDDLR